MGLTYVTATLRRSERAKRSVEVRFLVDSGAIFTVAPTEVLRGIGVKPDGEHTFTLANGEEITRKVGNAYFQIRGTGGYSRVIFGEEGDSKLLGTMTLEACLLVLDPIRRQLKPLPMVLM